MISFLDPNPFQIAKKNKKPLILDGAMGSLLQQKGFKSAGTTWMTDVNEKSPETIFSIHQEYIRSGADIITTNTFRTNPVALRGIKDLSLDDNVKNAVEIALKAKNNHNVFVAGSNAPAEDCYKKDRNVNQKELELNHINHIDLLINNGVDFILNETQSHFDEIKIICNHCSKNRIPYVLSIYVDSNVRILSGENIESICDFVWEHNPLAVGLNCITPEVFNNAIKHLNTENTWGFYLNCGAGEPFDEDISCGVNEYDYSDLVKNNLSKNPSFIGSCCGSSPGHTKLIKKVLDG